MHLDSLVFNYMCSIAIVYSLQMLIIVTMLVLQAGVPAFTVPQPPEAMKVLAERAAERQVGSDKAVSP